MPDQDVVRAAGDVLVGRRPRGGLRAKTTTAAITIPVNATVLKSFIGKA